MTPRQVKEFAEHKEADFAIGVPGVGRFRTNVYQQRGTVAFAFRAIPYEVKTVAELSACRTVLEEIADAAARPGAGHGRDRVGQVDRARGDDQPHQHHAARQHHHDRRPDRVPAPRQPGQHLAARGGERHPLVRVGAATRAAAGPRRDSDRRNPRHGNAGHGAQGRRHRTPGVLDPAHHRRHPVHQPRDLVLPPAPARRGAPPALDGAPGRGVAAAGAAAGRQRTGAGGGGADQYRHGAGQHPRPDQGPLDSGSDRRRVGAVRHADRSTSRCSNGCSRA